MTIFFKLCLGLAAVLCLSAAYTAYGSWQVERTFPPTGAYVTVDGLRLHYVERGEGPPLVLLHGASSSSRDFEAGLLPALAQSHRVIAFDRPGYGYSERNTDAWPDPAAQARLIHGALQSLGVRDPLIVGHSWGGSVVLAYLLEFPGQAAGGVLIAGAVNPWTSGVSWFVDLMGWPVLGPLFAQTAAFPLGQLILDSAIENVFAPEVPSEDYRARTGAILALRPAAFRASTEDVRNLSPFLEKQNGRYDAIDAPLLLITGGGDTIVPAWNHAEKLAARLPHAVHVDLPGAGHALHHTRTADIARLVEEFSYQALSAN